MIVKLLEQLGSEKGSGFACYTREESYVQVRRHQHSEMRK